MAWRQADPVYGETVPPQGDPSEPSEAARFRATNSTPQKQVRTNWMDDQETGVNAVFESSSMYNDIVSNFLLHFLSKEVSLSCLWAAPLQPCLACYQMLCIQDATFLSTFLLGIPAGLAWKHKNQWMLPVESHGLHYPPRVLAVMLFLAHHRFLVPDLPDRHQVSSAERELQPQHRKRLQHAKSTSLSSSELNMVGSVHSECSHKRPMLPLDLKGSCANRNKGQSSEVGNTCQGSAGAVCEGVHGKGEKPQDGAFDMTSASTEHEQKGQTLENHQRVVSNEELNKQPDIQRKRCTSQLSVSYSTAWQHERREDVSIRTEDFQCETTQSWRNSESHACTGADQVESTEVHSGTIRSSEEAPISGALNPRHTSESFPLSPQTDNSESLPGLTTPCSTDRSQRIYQRLRSQYSQSSTLDLCHGPAHLMPQTYLQGSNDVHFGTKQAQSPRTHATTGLARFLVSRNELQHELRVLKEVQSRVPPDPQSVLSRMLIAFAVDILHSKHMLSRWQAHIMSNPETLHACKPNQILDDGNTHGDSAQNTCTNQSNMQQISDLSAQAIFNADRELKALGLSAFSGSSQEDNDSGTEVPHSGTESTSTLAREIDQGIPRESSVYCGCTWADSSTDDEAEDKRPAKQFNNKSRQALVIAWRVVGLLQLSYIHS